MHSSNLLPFDSIISAGAFMDSKYVMYLIFVKEQDDERRKDSSNGIVT